MDNSQNSQSTVILITHNGMGHADGILQHKLITTYFKLLVDSNTLPAAICFYTDGVKLVTTGSPVIELLREMEAEGVHLVVCSTCLTHFSLQDQVEVGVVGGMTDIIEAQWRADKVITL